jgi:menaquinone-dependent protoporphyrinogen IX oxidase
MVQREAADGIGEAGEGRVPRVLLVCATRHGSTMEVAEAVAAELRETGVEVDLRPPNDDADPAGYDAVVVGGPMIMGWHREARGYVARRRKALARLPVTYFITAMSLTEDGRDRVGGVPVVKDTWLVKEPRDAGKLRYRERYALPAHYLDKLLKQAPEVSPVGVAFFAGSLDLTKMSILEKLFVTLVIGATPGDARHWEAIRGWARGLPSLLGLSAVSAPG